MEKVLISGSGLQDDRETVMTGSSGKPPKKPFDLLALAGSFAQQRGIPLNDPGFVASFLADAGPKLTSALADPAMLRGMRVERLFEATVISLGRYRMLKAEDIGHVHAAEKMRSPDFRVVLEDGVQWLVEVKKVYCPDPSVQETSMAAAYAASLRAYADAVGTPLRLAIHWTLWDIWTVIDPERFRRSDGGLDIEMMQAIMVNEFGRLGDRSIHTRAPLRLFLEKPSIIPEGSGDDALLNAVMEHGRVFSGDVELTDPRDRHLAILLFFYGEWTSEGLPVRLNEHGKPVAEVIAAPEEPSDDGINGIGWASRVFSRYFRTRTVAGDQIIQLEGKAAPEWFAPLTHWDFKNRSLPLWLFEQRVPEEFPPS